VPLHSGRRSAPTRTNRADGSSNSGPCALTPRSSWKRTGGYRRWSGGASWTESCGRTRTRRPSAAGSPSTGHDGPLPPPNVADLGKRADNEVHQAVEPPGRQADRPLSPADDPREHDRHLPHGFPVVGGTLKVNCDLKLMLLASSLFRILAFRIPGATTKPSSALYSVTLSMPSRR
jgi:hypothetical protein